MDRFDRIYRLHRIFRSARHPVPRKTLEEKLECSRGSRDVDEAGPGGSVGIDAVRIPVQADHSFVWTPPGLQGPMVVRWGRPFPVPGRLPFGGDRASQAVDCRLTY